MRPISIPHPILLCWQQKRYTPQICDTIRSNYASLYHNKNPEISIIIPAYNEEGNILGTLLSLTRNVTARSVEIIVVNNNSTDQTQQIVTETGINCICEKTPGVTAARNAGLMAAKGKYILNADADTIYPKDWIEEMIVPIETGANITLTYGRFSFIPTGGTSRLIYFFYEYIADFMRWLNRYLKDEAVNVYGFNSGCRREDAIIVDGFTHPPGTNEDGWLAVKLRKKELGKLHYVKKTRAIVWTTDRRIEIDGGLWKASIRRIKRMFFKGPR